MNNMSEIVIEQPQGLGSFTIGDLGVFIGTLGGVITSILIVLQKSHCKRIKFCCWECDRDTSNIPTEEELAKGPVAQANEERAKGKKVIQVPQQVVDEEQIIPGMGVVEPEPEPQSESLMLRRDVSRESEQNNP